MVDNLKVGSLINLRYNDKDRVGVVERKEPSYIVVEVAPGQYRTFLIHKIHNLEVLS